MREPWRASIVDSRAAVGAASESGEASVGLLSCRDFNVASEQLHDALNDVVYIWTAVASPMFRRPPRRHRHEGGQLGRV